MTFITVYFNRINTAFQNRFKTPYGRNYLITIDNNKMQRIQLFSRTDWCTEASKCFDDYSEVCMPYLTTKQAKLPSLVQLVTNQLYTRSAQSSKSTLMLLAESNPWDADILLRTVIEGSAKLSYLLNCNVEKMNERAEEYWVIMPKSMEIRDSERAREVMSAVRDPEHIRWEPLQKLIMNSEEKEQLQKRYPKKWRKELHNKWSFSKILKSITTSGDQILENYTLLLHNYNLNCHLSHADGTGLMHQDNRNMLEVGRREVAELAHIARIIKDLCALRQLVTYSLLKANNAPLDPVLDVLAKYKHLTCELDHIYHIHYNLEYALLEEHSSCQNVTD